MKIIVYYRVSTKGQEVSGLGLEAQRVAKENFLRSRPEAEVLAEYTEIESGTHSDRPVLLQALQRVKRAGATLVVAKLDRLARSVSFTSTLLDSGVDFICCDNPNATRLTIHILAAVAEDEARRISERTKAALARLKARGVKLGAHNPKVADALARRRQGGGWGTMARRRVQRERYESVMPIINAMRLRSSYQEIADHLNAQGYRTSRGKEFSASTVMRVFQRQAELVLAS